VPAKRSIIKRSAAESKTGKDSTPKIAVTKKLQIIYINFCLFLFLLLFVHAMQAKEVEAITISSFVIASN
jgi:hypothetical protein